MKKKMTIAIMIIALMSVFIFTACEQESRVEQLREEAESEYAEFKEDIENLSEDDPQFVDNLESELAEFEQDMQNIREDMREAADGTAGAELEDYINEALAEARQLESEVQRWAARTGEDMEAVGDSISEDFQEFKQFLGELTPPETEMDNR